MCIVGKGRTYVLTDGTVREFPEELCSEVLTQYAYGCYNTPEYKCSVIRRYRCDSFEMIASYYLQKAIEGGDNSPYWDKFYNFYQGELKTFPCDAWVEQWVNNLGYEAIARADGVSEAQKKVIKSLGISGDGRIYEAKKQFGKLNTHIGIRSNGRGVTFLVGVGFKF